MTATSRLDAAADPMTRHAAIALPRPAFFAGIGRLIGEFRRRRQLAELTDLSDHLLRDIGLTRGEIGAALAGSPTGDAVRTVKRLSAHRLARGD